MHLSVYMAALTAYLLAGLCLTSGANIRIGAPEFTRAELEEADGSWLEVAVPLRLEPGQSGGKATLAITVAWTADGGQVPLLFTESTVSFACVGEGRRMVWMYVHPEVVAHFHLQETPQAWWVRISNGDGNPLAQARSANIDTEERFARFQALHEEQKETHALLLPIYRTPFYSERYPERLEASPAYLWE